MKKNTILKLITFFFVLVYLIGACLLDSDCILPYVLMSIATVWLLPFAYANSEEYRQRQKERRDREQHED